jgi:hypothetical protein
MKYGYRNRSSLLTAYCEKIVFMVKKHYFHQHERSELYEVNPHSIRKIKVYFLGLSGKEGVSFVKLLIRV